MSNQIHNPHCDGGHCRSANGEVRKYPYGSSGANMILCISCWAHENHEREAACRQGVFPASATVQRSWHKAEVYDA